MNLLGLDELLVFKPKRLLLLELMVIQVWIVLMNLLDSVVFEANRILKIKVRDDVLHSSWKNSFWRHRLDVWR